MSGLRARIEAGEELLGTFLDLGSPLAAEIAAGAGFDWLVLDLEHGAGGRDDTLGQLHAARVPTLVRVPSAASEELGWVLDFGAAGVVVPRVEGTAGAARAVERTRYRELGFTLIASGSAAGLLAGTYAERLAALRA